jgi:hypothetical protein
LRKEEVAPGVTSSKSRAAQEGRKKEDMKQVKQTQDFGTFRIAADGKVFVRDLALLQAIREEMHQEAVNEKVTVDVVHVASMPHYSPASYSTLA